MNEEPPDLPSPLALLMERMAEEPQIWARAAATWHEYEAVWKLALLEAFAGAPPDNWVEQTWEYEHAVLGSCAVTGKTFADWVAEGHIHIGSISLSFTAQTGLRRERRDSRQAGMDEPLPWPSVAWRTETTDGAGGALHDTLVADGAPVFLNFDQAAAAFFRTPAQINRRFDGHDIVIRKQDLRARIEHVRILTAELVVTVGGHDRSGKRLTLSGPDGGTLKLDATTAEWSLPQPNGLPPAAWLALHADRQLIDSRALDPSWRPPGDVVFEIEAATRIEGLVSRGEGSTLEFKEGLPGDDVRRVMKTVAAFANSEGGTLLFGVTDEQQIVGLGGTLSRKAIDRVTSLISDHVHPHVLFTIEVITVSGAAILAIHVQPGPDTPYGVGTDLRKLTYYVRRGANSSPARPEDIRYSVRSRIPADNGQGGTLL